MKKFATTAAVAAALLAACTGVNTVTSDVESYSQWPAERAPASYAFERLPSQAAHAGQQARLEAAAAPALEKAGFTRAPDLASADVSVQLGVRISRYDRSPIDDPLWWHGSFGYWRHPRAAWWGPGFGLHYQSTRYDREVALLIRDRKTGQPLYEARASNDGLTAGDDTVIRAMFQAALQDFPRPAVNPRRVSVTVPN